MEEVTVHNKNEATFLLIKGLIFLLTIYGLIWCILNARFTPFWPRDRLRGRQPPR
jgi:hypothetical protein